MEPYSEPAWWRRRIQYAASNTFVAKPGTTDTHLDSLDSLAAHSWHGHDIRGSGKLMAIDDAGLATDAASCQALPSPTSTATSQRQPRNNRRDISAARATRQSRPRPRPSRMMKSSARSCQTAFHANEASRIVACRNPSLLEMARAHSIPDSFDWCGATKSDRGKMIANSVPSGLAAGVSSAILRALVPNLTHPMKGQP